MKEVIEKSIKTLAGKAGGASDSADALKFSQAATNLATALSSFDDNVRSQVLADKRDS